jgi:hypothetical protein
MPAPHDPIKAKIWRENLKKRSKNPSWIENQKNGCLKRSSNPIYIEHLKNGCLKRSSNIEYLEKISNSLKQKHIDDKDFHNHMIEINNRVTKTKEWMDKNKIVRENNLNKPGWCEKIKDGQQKSKNNDINKWYKIKRDAIVKAHNNPLWRSKQKQGCIDRSKDILYYISRFKYIWYGSVKYYDDELLYCEKWNSDLRNRIRMRYDHKSVLSGKTKIDNKNRELCCHHVYYQKKSCCEWDEDNGAFYAYIDGYKYYIKGDPNKFVTLTNSEHAMVNHNRLKWVKFFEDIIETKYNGKSYIHNMNII